jgi:hypothetical protein
MAAMFARLSLARPRVPSLFFDSRRTLAALHERFAEAQRALAHARADFAVPCPTTFLAGWSAEAYRAELSGAWHQAQDRLRGFERHLRTVYQSTVQADLPRQRAPHETVTQMLLPLWFAHYCDQAARYASAEQEGARPLPLEWLQMAALAAIVQVVQTVVMLAVLNRASTAPRAAHPMLRMQPAPRPPRVQLIARPVSLPLRL